MLYRNYSNKTALLYDKEGKLYRVIPGGKLDDTVVPMVKFLKDIFIPHGMKRIAKHGDRQGATKT